MKERWWQAGAAREALGDWTARSVADWMDAAARPVPLSTDRDAAAVRLPGPTGALLVKWRRPRGRKTWKHAWRPSRERREARGLLMARALGIDVPAPLLVGERRTALGRLVGSVLVRPWIEGLENAHELLGEAGGEGLWPALLHAVRGWHDAGFRHGDAWPKNFLLARDGSRALPIGAPKAWRAGPGARLDRRRLRDVARLAAGARRLWPARDALALLEPYAHAPGRPPLAGLAAAVAPLLASVEARRAEDERTRPAREPHGPPLPVPLAPDARPVPRRLLDLARLNPRA